MLAKTWQEIENAAKQGSALPLGYAGNLAGYEAVGKHVEEMLVLQAEDIAERICGDKV